MLEEVFFKVRQTLWMLFGTSRARNFELGTDSIANEFINCFIGDVQFELANEPLLNLTIATAMDDIAKIAGISRASLYLLFQNKEDIFRTLSEHLHSNALVRVETALQSEIGFRDRLNAAFEGKDLELFELVCDSPDGSELMDLKNAIAADIFLSSSKRFEELLKEAIRQADERGEIELSRGSFQPSN